MINIVYEENRKNDLEIILQDLKKLFDFIEKNKVKVLALQGNYNYRVTQQDFNDFLTYIYRNTTLEEINLNIFEYLIKHNSLQIDIKDLLQRHKTLERVYLTAYSQAGSFSYVIYK